MITPQKQVEMDTPTLKRLTDRALELKFSRGPNERFWREVDPHGRHVVAFWMHHTPRYYLWGDWRKKPDFPWNFDHNNGVNIRAVLLCKMRGKKEPVELICDFDEQDFLALGNLKVDSPKQRVVRWKESSKRKKRMRAAKAGRANEGSHA